MVVASGSVIVEDMTEHEHAVGHTDGDEGTASVPKDRPEHRERCILGMNQSNGSDHP